MDFSSLREAALTQLRNPDQIALQQGRFGEEFFKFGELTLIKPGVISLFYCLIVNISKNNN
ncbi:hypothetical protein CV014_00455 [Nostoc sp. CMAA1605]|nr:hypothetical protein [Nostoc sp. CMAA1605]